MVAALLLSKTVGFEVVGDTPDEISLLVLMVVADEIALLAEELSAVVDALEAGPELICDTLVPVDELAEPVVAGAEPVCETEFVVVGPRAVKETEDCVIGNPWLSKLCGVVGAAGLMVTSVGNPLLFQDVLTSRPEARDETEAKDETGGDEVEGGVTCVNVSIEGKHVQGAQEYELTAPELGGETLQSDPTVHPLGSPEGTLVQA